MAREEILPQLNPSRKGRIGKYPTSECNTTKNEVSFKLKRLPQRKKKYKEYPWHFNRLDKLYEWKRFFEGRSQPKAFKETQKHLFYQFLPILNFFSLFILFEVVNWMPQRLKTVEIYYVFYFVVLKNISNVIAGKQ